ncbi:hypothetical protein BU25DRAFT_481041 [Macroventuria anomochaeta]|uniref:Uncharacterized protein n=1 Tax=Macroventuria anomochaeta TaxID=301207 RepID=A0ACB6RKH3_9PLEO|nr:uncharacterized protein BU25DRAFT_481041 [Macroventuria anomochaeta]KAF2622202.1 hypothetical protein BU25DRAFT_481041 [Macroventuria anomochaeta]
MTTTWQSTALDRLMLCHLALHDVGTALEYGRRSIAMSTQQPDPTVRALSRFYYGLALHHSGRPEEAIEIWQQTGKHDSCTAAIALSKDPTTENIEHLRILAKHEVRFSHHDEYGLSVLDYSFLGDNERLKTVAIEGLRREFSHPDDNGLTLEMSRIEERIANLLVETQRRKKYRETFQLTLRPILNKLAVSLPLGLSDDEVYIKGHAHRQEGIDSLRQGYLRQRDMSSETCSLFDRLVMLRYRDFKEEMTRLPRPHSGDDMQEVMHLRRQYSALRDVTDMKEKDTQPEFLVFLSYRWLGKGSPDDRTNTQYQRMLDALDLYLRMHPWLDQDRVSVWLDVVCIDQVDLEVKQRGINALPLVVAQCNALISILDSEYLSRAWCSVEVLMIQTLRNSYGVHEHWNYDYKTGILAEAETIPPINDDLDGLNLSYPEVDEPTVKFLVRQSRILAKT